MWQFFSGVLGFPTCALCPFFLGVLCLTQSDSFFKDISP